MNSNTSHKATLSIDETAKLLGISRATAFAAAHRGEIPFVRFGKLMRVPKHALDRLLESATAPSKIQEGKS